MYRSIVALLIAVSLAAGCAGSAKLSKKSEEKLASGDAWKAWQLATRALDKEPGNPRAQAAATKAGTAIVQDWQRKIRAYAELDSAKAAAEVLAMTEFRGEAARYATIPMGESWAAEELALRRAGARIHYNLGVEATSAGRPKKACNEFSEARQYVSDYRDVVKREDRAASDAMTHVAVMPFRAMSDDRSFGTELAQAWQDDLVENLAPPTTQFTRVVSSDAVRRSMTLADLDDVSREQAVRLARKAGAERVVWGSVGPVKSSTKLHLFQDNVYRRVVERGPNGSDVVRWVEVPIQVVSRVRDVKVSVDYEVIDTRSGTSVVHRHLDRSSSARVVWTSDRFDGDPSSYVLVSEPLRAANPDRAKEIETRWNDACGAGTTIVQVLEARKNAGSTGRYARQALPRFAAGAAFVFMEDLPPADDLALAALTQSSRSVRDDLVNMDNVDDVDLGVVVPDAATR
ncbi:MAG TPA: hypothetical protein VL857_10670 [Candidatus Eisenbacteria bacterium]|jgi:TolB-like protein|nr:hypothetical protein [Candidatus Eisenbacteria bacterium]